MILYQCYAPAQPTTSPLLFFFTPTLIQPPSACPLSSTLLFPVLPTPSSLVPTLSLLSPLSSFSGLWIWCTHRAEEERALERATTPRPPPPPPLGASVGGPVCAFPPAAETKPLCSGLRLSWELWKLFTRIYISAGRRFLLVTGGWSIAAFENTCTCGQATVSRAYCCQHFHRSFKPQEDYANHGKDNVKLFVRPPAGDSTFSKIALLARSGLLNLARLNRAGSTKLCRHRSGLWFDSAVAGYVAVAAV